MRLQQILSTLWADIKAYIQTNYSTKDTVVHNTDNETIAGTKTFSSKIVGDLQGNADTTTTLKTARKINGTAFNGSENITTAQWGTARNIYISDSDGTNTSAAVSVNGSANATLKLPATIKGTLTGNAATATNATNDSAGNNIINTYATSASVVHLAGAETITGNKTMNLASPRLFFKSTDHAKGVTPTANKGGGSGILHHRGRRRRQCYAMEV